MKKIHLEALPGEPETWCGRIIKDQNFRTWKYTENNIDLSCKVCAARICKDCNGTGFMNGRTVGIYCPCNLGVEFEVTFGY